MNKLLSKIVYGTAFASHSGDVIGAFLGNFGWPGGHFESIPIEDAAAADLQFGRDAAGSRSSLAARRHEPGIPTFFKEQITC